jgi:hypothetical protein
MKSLTETFSPIIYVYIKFMRSFKRLTPEFLGKVLYDD